MVILCDGMHRSGSTWSFNVALKLVGLCDPDRKTFGLYNDNPVVIRAAIRPRSSHLVIKSHTLDPSAYELCCKGDIKAIYTWRHPYDVVLSCMRIFDFSAEHCIGLLRNSLRLWSFHRQTGSACVIPYQAILLEPLAAIERIASWLGMQIGPHQLRQVADEVSLGRLKDLSQRIDQLEPRRVVRQDGFIYDRQTLLHQNHVMDGRMGHGARMLECRQLLAIDAMLVEEGFGFLCQPHGVRGPDDAAIAQVRQQDDNR